MHWKNIFTDNRKEMFVKKLFRFIEIINLVGENIWRKLDEISKNLY